MTDLVFEEEDEGLARQRMYKLASFMVHHGEVVGRPIRRYESAKGDTYQLQYSLERHGDWHAKLSVNQQTLCAFLFPESWFNGTFGDLIKKAKAHPILEERVFISEFYEFIEDYREEE